MTQIFIETGDKITLQNDKIGISKSCCCKKCNKEVCDITLEFLDENKCEDDVFDVYVVNPETANERFVEEVDLVADPPGSCGNPDASYADISVPITIGLDDWSSDCKVTIQVRFNRPNCCSTWTRFRIRRSDGSFFFSQYFSIEGLSATYTWEELCVGAPCESDVDCTDGRCCVEKRCGACPCDNNEDCPPDECCIQGFCGPCECEENEDCPEGQCCEDGECGPCPCNNDDDCPPNQCCENGRCGPCPCEDDSDCPDGECCEDGECRPCPPCENDADCPEGDCCVEGKCRPCPCNNDNDCPAGQCCENGKCGPCRCRIDDDCPEGFICLDGRCVPAGDNPGGVRWSCCYPDVQAQPGQPPPPPGPPTCVQGPCRDANGNIDPTLVASGPHATAQACADACRSHNCVPIDCCESFACIPVDNGQHPTLQACQENCGGAGVCVLPGAGKYVGFGTSTRGFSINCQANTPICVRYASIKCGPIRVQIRSNQLDEGGNCIIVAEDVIRVDSRWKGKLKCCNDIPDLIPKPDGECTGSLRWRTKQAGIVSFDVVVFAPCGDQWEFDIQCGNVCQDPCLGRDPPCDQDCCPCRDMCNYTVTATGSRWGETATAKLIPGECIGCGNLTSQDSKDNPNREDEQYSDSNYILALASKVGNTHSCFVDAVETYNIQPNFLVISDLYEEHDTLYTADWTCQEVDGKARWLGSFQFFYNGRKIIALEGIYQKIQETNVGKQATIQITNGCPTKCDMTIRLTPDNISIDGVMYQWPAQNTFASFICREFTDENPWQPGVALENNGIECEDYVYDVMASATFLMECKPECPCDEDCENNLI